MYLKRPKAVVGDTVLEENFSNSNVLLGDLQLCWGMAYSNSSGGYYSNALPRKFAPLSETYLGGGYLQTNLALSHIMSFAADAFTAQSFAFTSGARNTASTQYLITGKKE